MVRALKTLEYRGYDSYGFGAISCGELKLFKDVGAISEINQENLRNLAGSTTAIGHTRWATHGAVTRNNSHPHADTANSVAIVHNGVITNFDDLRRANPKWDLRSETDTEIAANLIADCIAESGGNLRQALEKAIGTMMGEFAICGISRAAPHVMFAIKRKSPLLMAADGLDTVIASDKSAFSEFADTLPVHYLEDDTILICDNNSRKLWKGIDGAYQESQFIYTEEDVASQRVELGQYKHFMIKEINESAQAVTEIRRSMRAGIDRVIDLLATSNCSIVGSGSAFYVGLLGQYFFARLARKHVPAYPSDEFLNLYPTRDGNVIIAISQSGETFDTLDVLRHAVDASTRTIALNNVPGSSMQRLVDVPLIQNAGREICVLSTKSIISQAVGLYLMAAECGASTESLSASSLKEINAELDALPDAISHVIRDTSAKIQRVAKQYCIIEHWFFIGRGVHYAVALESALKFKEVSYLHAEGMSAGFFKHGTISLIDENFYTVAFVPDAASEPDLYQLTIDNIHEIRARGGNVIGFGSALLPNIEDELFIEYVTLPSMSSGLTAILQIVAGQLFAYFCALSLGRNIDRPRALAKSVTVR